MGWIPLSTKGNQTCISNFPGECSTSSNTSPKGNLPSPLYPHLCECLSSGKDSNLWILSKWKCHPEALGMVPGYGTYGFKAHLSSAFSFDQLLGAAPDFRQLPILNSSSELYRETFDVYLQVLNSTPEVRYLQVKHWSTGHWGPNVLYWSWP